MRTVAFVMRFPMNVRSKLAGKQIATGPLGQEELLRAEYFIYKQVQHQTYSEEVRLLMSDVLGSRKRIIPKKSPLYQLSPATFQNFMQHSIVFAGIVSSAKFDEQILSRP